LPFLRVVRRVVIIVSVTLAAFGGAFIAAGTIFPSRDQTAPAPVAAAQAATVKPDVLALRYRPGPQWTGGAGRSDSLTHDQIDAFAEWPLFWLDTTFASYNLQNVIQDKGRMIFLYGICTPDSAGQCYPPVQMYSAPVCSVVPERVAVIVRAGPVETVRGGALLQRFVDGHVEIWTGEVRISISTPVDVSLITAAIGQLRLVRASAESGEGADLPPPDFSGC
jgi:hypothetical protein